MDELAFNSYTKSKLARQTQAINMLLGMLHGVMADGALNDMEVQMISTWLTDNEDVTDVWPASAVALRLRTALADGRIDADEREHLQNTINQILGNEFAQTGDTASAATSLPVNDQVKVDLEMMFVCFTGDAAYGTRGDCIKLQTRAGGLVADAVSKKVRYLVVGQNSSPDWAHASFGRKIQRAMELQEQGHPIFIISEKRWLEAASAAVSQEVSV